MANIVAIVGRPNVGKSTLFNRLVEKRDAIMDDVSGVTRDRHYGQAEWIGKTFTVMDTGGYVSGSDDAFEEAIREQVLMALEEAAVILFMVDCQTGLTGLDRDFARVVRRSEKPVILVANKADNYEQLQMANEFYELGVEEIFPIAAANGSGTGELLDKVVTHLEEEPPPQDLPRIAIVGRPNVGKSSLVNTLLDQSRSIVTDIAGTTRDAVDAHYKAFGKEFILTDTAGIRKKSRVKENIEFYSVLRAITAIENCDVCILVIDATQGFEGQDASILHLAHKHKKGIVLMVNKWDLIEKDSNTAKAFEAEIENRLGDMRYVPIIFTSVLGKQRIFKVIEKAIAIAEQRTTKIATSKLNDVLLPEIERYPPPAHRGKYIKIKYITQLPTYTPTFAFFCNHPKHIKKPYVSYLENKLRKHFDLEGVPVKLIFRQK